jgi:hypothetical protein
MFRLSRKPSSGSHNQYLTKITGLVQCRYRRRIDVSDMMSVSTLNQAVVLASNWLWLPDQGFLVNRNMLEQP